MKLYPLARKRESAFATAAVFILLLAASALMLTTAVTLRQLHKELRFVEKRQVEHWTGKQLRTADSIKPVSGGATGGTTNAVAASAQP